MCLGRETLINGSGAQERRDKAARAVEEFESDREK
jgi:hypothetical protein